MNSYTKRGGAARRRFCVICKKNLRGGGAEINPPGVRVLTKNETIAEILNNTHQRAGISINFNSFIEKL